MARSKKLSAAAEKNAKIIYDRLQKSERKNDTDRLFIILYEKYQNGVDYTYKDVDFLKAVIAQDEAERKARNRLADIARDERKAKTRELNHRKYKIGGLILGAESSIKNLFRDNIQVEFEKKLMSSLCVQSAQMIILILLTAVERTPNNARYRKESMDLAKKFLPIKSVEGKRNEYVLISVDLGLGYLSYILFTVSLGMINNTDKYEYEKTLAVVECKPNQDKPLGVSRSNTVSYSVEVMGYRNLDDSAKKEKMREQINTITEFFEELKSELDKQ